MARLTAEGMTRHEAFISGDHSESGISSVIVARIRGPADVEMGVFLVATGCLGIKDALFIGYATETASKKKALKTEA